MWQLLKNVTIFSPEPSPETDLLIVDSSIAAMGKSLTLPSYAEGVVIDGYGYKLVPGFIDAHVHICGGGGEAGPTSRTPEIQLSQVVRAGTTTIVGLLGTDAITRSVSELLVKAQALQEEGLTTYIYSGAYQVPTRTLFPTLREDLVLIDKVIGAGEIAISDHRSGQPQIAELGHLAAEARVGGMLGGKAGIVHLHLGDGKRGLEPVWTILNQTEIPITQFVPTHINRTYALLEQGVEFLKAGGYIDLTAGCDDFPLNLQVPAVLDMLYMRGLLSHQVTVSSDGNGSMPIYNDTGELVGMGVGTVDVLWRDVREAILNYSLPLEAGLRVITSNVATVLRLSRKGLIKVGYDADLVLLDEELRVHNVWAKGKLMVKDKEPLVYGTYERKSTQS